MNGSIVINSPSWMIPLCILSIAVRLCSEFIKYNSWFIPSRSSSMRRRLPLSIAYSNPRFNVSSDEPLSPKPLNSTESAASSSNVMKRGYPLFNVISQKICKVTLSSIMSLICGSNSLKKTLGIGVYFVLLGKPLNSLITDSVVCCRSFPDSRIWTVSLERRGVLCR